jgi:hypothetical protein
MFGFPAAAVSVGSQSSPEKIPRQLAGDEVGATRRATRFGVVVGEHHAFGRQLVEVWRLAGHHSAVVSADVEPTDIVAHDDKDVGLLPLLLQIDG